MVAVALAAASLAGCAPASVTPTDSQSQTGQLKVVTSVAVWASIAQEIGGSAVSASAIISQPSQDPHSYEATVRDQLRVNQADLTITNGADYDLFFAKLVEHKPSPKPGMSLVLAKHIDQHTPSPNPHLWYDLRWVRSLAAVIGSAEAKAAKNEAVATQIRARQDRFIGRLDQLIAEESKLVHQTVGKGAILGEGFAERMIRNLAIFDETPREFRNSVEQEQDASPATMQTMKWLIESRRVQVVILNRQTMGTQTNQLETWAAQGRVPVLKLSELLPPHTSYLNWMQSNLNQIAEALR
jgi:zinc/manganese transport system substrate-binding protein